MEPLIGQSATPADAVKDSDTANFAQDVLAASREVPVVVDFWAPWCGPCKQLGPQLEKAVRAAGGKVKLVKIDVDQNAELAQQLQVQSIPAVYAFKDGQPVDGFVGALPESQIKSFIQRLTGDRGPSQVDQAVEMAQQALQAGDADRAGQIFAQVLRAEPDNARAIGGLAQAALAKGDLAAARQVLESVDPAMTEQAEIASARAALELAEQAGEVGDLAELQAAVAADPGNHQARYDLANALVAAGQREEGVEHLLEIVQRERTWDDEAARKRLLKLFEAFGPTDPLTQSARRRLSAILFS